MQIALQVDSVDQVAARIRENTHVKRTAWNRAILLAFCGLPLWAAGLSPATAHAQLALTVVQGEGSYNQPIKANYAAGSAGFGASLGTRFVVPRPASPPSISIANRSRRSSRHCASR